MENAWIFPSIYHSTGKCNKINDLGKVGKLILIPIVRVLFSHYIPILQYTLSHGKCMYFLINFL